MHYYNEIDEYAATWIENLILDGRIPDGHVDRRSVVDVVASDLSGYVQCHFFAGVAGWALAARLAGWPEGRELWTGSAPCQPFSVAGQQRGIDDGRHLWPHLFRLVRARRPAVLMGEQVAAAVGKDWLDGIAADLEGIGYACGATVVPACAVDAPHRRDRLWFVADAERIGIRGEGRGAADAAQTGVQGADWKRKRVRADPGAVCVPGSACVGDAADTDGSGWRSRIDNAPAGHREAAAAEGRRSAWDSATWIAGHDGKARRTPEPESGIRLLAHGVSGRVAVVRPGFESDPENPEAFHWYNRTGALRAYGNAIVPQVAAEVIGAYMDCMP